VDEFRSRVVAYRINGEARRSQRMAVSHLHSEIGVDTTGQSHLPGSVGDADHQ